MKNPIRPPHLLPGGMPAVDSPALDTDEDADGSEAGAALIATVVRTKPVHVSKAAAALCCQDRKLCPRTSRRARCTRWLSSWHPRTA